MTIFSISKIILTIKIMIKMVVIILLSINKNSNEFNNENKSNNSHNFNKHNYYYNFFSVIYKFSGTNFAKELVTTRMLLTRIYLSSKKHPSKTIKKNKLYYKQNLFTDRKCMKYLSPQQISHEKNTNPHGLSSCNKLASSTFESASQ